jgi:hypothetical protein
MCQSPARPQPEPLISFIKTTTRPWSISKEEAARAYKAYGPATIPTSEVYEAACLCDIQDSAGHVVDRFNSTDTCQSDAIKCIMSNLARITERTGGIIPSAHTVFEDLDPKQSNPIRLVKLRQDLQRIARASDDWQEFATCIGKIRQARGTADLLTEEDGPGFYIAIFPRPHSKTFQCMLGGYTSTSTAERNKLDHTFAAGKCQGGLSATAFRNLGLDTKDTTWMPEQRAAVTGTTGHGVTRFRLIPTSQGDDEKDPSQSVNLVNEIFRSCSEWLVYWLADMGNNVQNIEAARLPAGSPRSPT